MKRLAILAFGTIALSACTSTPGPIVEAGYPTGSLGLAAIERGDWAAAERQLTADSQVDRDNPARLINLGRVYAETGRTEQALAVWRQALASRNHSEVELLSGGTATTAEIARRAIAHYERTLETAAR